MAFRCAQWESIAFISHSLLSFSPFFLILLSGCLSNCLSSCLILSKKQNSEREKKSSDNHTSSSIRHHPSLGAFVLSVLSFCSFEIRFLRCLFHSVFFSVTDPSKLPSKSVTPHFICGFHVRVIESICITLWIWTFEGPENLFSHSFLFTMSFGILDEHKMILHVSDHCVLLFRLLFTPVLSGWD